MQGYPTKKLVILSSVGGLMVLLFILLMKDSKLLWGIDSPEVILKSYSRLFNKGQLDPSVSPNVISSIKTWWQAAAMIDSYTRGPVRYNCKQLVAMGNWHVCMDAPYTVAAPCLVYSFGINFDFSFDDAMGSLGCEVHSFDPSMHVGDHKRSDNITFHAIGLHHRDDDKFSPRKDNYVTDDQKWKVRTLHTLIKELGHEKRVIDVLKIDIEGYEWQVVADIMATGLFPRVKQFLTEWHLFPDHPKKEEFVDSFKIYSRLREMGLLEFRVSPHPSTLEYDHFNIQGDSEYVNRNFKHPQTVT